MLASLILSLSLLGFVQGQLFALRTSEQAYLVSLADLKNNELAERLRSCGNISSCVQEQSSFWKEDVKKNFPEAEARLTRQGSDCQSEMSWFSISQHAKPLRFFNLLFRP